MSESEKLNRSLTPCLDENRVDDENCADNSKEIELSDISDDDEQWSECNNKSDDIRTNGRDQIKGSAFKKITRSNRERNYRDNLRRRNDGNDYYHSRSNMRRFDNSRRKEIERYNVRKVIANREFSISRSRSRSFSPPPRPIRAEIPSRHPKHSSFSPKRDIYKQSLSPVSRQKRFSPISPRHSSSPDRYRNYPYNKRSISPEEVTRRSRSKHRHTKTKSVEKTLKRKKNRSKDHQRRHKKSRSKSKRHSSPEQSVIRNHISPSRQIMNISNPNLPQENIRVILKNEDFIKRQKVKKRDKKSNKKDKNSRKDARDKLSVKNSKEHQPPQTKKEVFASGDNILISVCFNNNNNNNTGSSNNNNVISKDSNNDHNKLKTADIVSEEIVSITKSKSRKRQQSPVASAVSSNESFDKLERRQRKHKRKKIKNRRERNHSKEPHTPPMNPPSNVAKRKNDTKPIAIIDLEKSPGKEVTQSPKEVIILSDSEGENKKREGGNKEIVIIEDTILEKGISIRNHSSPPREHHHTPPESPPPPISQPVLKFSLKSKSNILPFNLLHDQAEEVEDSNIANNNNNNTNNSNVNSSMEQQNNMQQEVGNNNNNNNMIMNEEKNTNDQNEAYDPFEPTKSGSTSPITPPPPSDKHQNDINKNSNKLEGLNEKLQLIANNKDSGQIPGLGIEDQQANQSSSLWSGRKEFEKKSIQPITPPMPPTFVFSSSNASISKPHISSLYDGIYGSDLKTPVVPSPIKSNIKPSQIDKSNKDDDDDDMTPYSPSSDGYGGSNDYEPPPSTSIHQSKNAFDTMKHSDTQSSEPSVSYSFDDPPSKTTPLKLTASTLKSFNSTMRSGGPVGLQYVNKAELSIFENYLPSSQQKSPHVKRQPNSSFLRSKMSRFTSSMNENGSPHRNISYTDSLKPPAIDESVLLLDDDVPSSAVDLANKDRFLKKSLRIERVAEEVKLVLKPHYNKKHITKEEYKEILRKAVPKICHNKTGEINIQKITQLIEAYIKKVRYKRKSVIASSI